MKLKNKEEPKKKEYDLHTALLFCGIFALLIINGQYIAMSITLLSFVLWTKN